MLANIPSINSRATQQQVAALSPDQKREFKDRLQAGLEILNHLDQEQSERLTTEQNRNVQAYILATQNVRARITLSETEKRAADSMLDNAAKRRIINDNLGFVANV